MDVRAAVAVAAGKPLEVATVQLEGPKAFEVLVVNTAPEGLRLVEEGKVDAFAQDDILLYGLIAASAQKADLWVTGKFMSVEPYAFMVPKDDAPFRELIDQTTAGLMRTGEINTIYRKWFDTDELRIPMSSYLKENIRFPNKYGIP